LRWLRVEVSWFVFFHSAQWPIGLSLIPEVSNGLSLIVYLHLEDDVLQARLIRVLLSARGFGFRAEADDYRSNITVRVDILNACRIELVEHTADYISPDVARDILDKQEVLVWRFRAIE
jgi:hypothetical protein